jgi:hypothetical protein
MRQALQRRGILRIGIPALGLLVLMLAACTHASRGSQPSLAPRPVGPNGLTSLGQLSVPAGGSATITASVAIGEPQNAGVPRDVSACNAGGPTTFIAIPGEVDLTLAKSTLLVNSELFFDVLSAGSIELYLASDKADNHSIAAQVAMRVGGSWLCGGSSELSEPTIPLQPGATIVPIWIFAYDDAGTSDMHQLADWVLVMSADVPGVTASGFGNTATSVSGPQAVHCTDGHGENEAGLLLYGSAPQSRKDSTGVQFKCVKA